MTDESWTKPRKRERGRFARNLGIVVVVLLAAGAALVGFSVLDRSALPSWIPPSVAQYLPDSSRLRRSLLASWSEARARFGPANPLAPAPAPCRGQSFTTTSSDWSNRSSNRAMRS